VGRGGGAVSAYVLELGANVGAWVSEVRDVVLSLSVFEWRRAERRSPLTRVVVLRRAATHSPAPVLLALGVS